MLKPDYFDGKSAEILRLYQQLEDFIFKDIANRLLTSGEMSGTADRLIWKLQQLGESRRMIEDKLSRLTGLTRQELKKLLQDAVMTSWEYDKQSMEQWMGNNYVKSPLVNPAVIRVMDAEYHKSLRTLDNLSRTTMEQSQRDLMNMFNEIDVRMAAGVQSYSAAVCDILDNYAGKGVVIYPTLRNNGEKYQMTIEAAVNLVVRTSLNQTTAQITNQYIIEAGAEYVLVSAHYGARHSKYGGYIAQHDLWQGKVYKIRGEDPDCPNLLASTGYDIDENGVGHVVNPLGLHGYNCRHSHQPWDKNLRNPWVDEDGNSIIDTVESRELYEDQQKARAMERAIRKTKRELLMKEEEMKNPGDMDPQKLQQDYDRLSYKLREQNKRYNEFCEQNNIPKQYERIKGAGFTKSEAAKANGAATRYANEHIKIVAKPYNSDIIESRDSMKSGIYPTSDSVIKDISETELSGVRFSHEMVYNGRIRSQGKTTAEISRLGKVEIKSVEIGKQVVNTRECVIDTMLHEELEARIMLRAKGSSFYSRLNSMSDNDRHKYINKVIERFFVGKGLDYGKTKRLE